MQNFEMTISRTVDTWTCQHPDCGMEFAILNVMRPSEEYKGEYPETADSTWSEWGNRGTPPFCPHCGNKLAANAEIVRLDAAGGQSERMEG